MSYGNIVAIQAVASIHGRPHSHCCELTQDLHVLQAYGSDNDDDNEAAPMNTDPSEDCILLESIEASVPQSAALIAARAALKPDAAASAPPEAAQQPPAAAAEQSKAAAAEAAQQPPQAAAPAQQTPQHRGRGETSDFTKSCAY